MAPTKRTSTGPESLALSSSRDSCHFIVGRCLGAGAQAAVHVVVDEKTGKETDFAVKLAPLPEKLAAPKKKKSLTELNADSLNGEYAAYTAFCEEQGTDIPKIPPFTKAGVPVKGEILVNGTPKYRYLVMERMESPFFTIADSLLLSSQSPSASVGLVLVRLIDIVERIHRKLRIVIDVKADNFMLVKSDSSFPPGTTVVEALAKRIRIIDLASLRVFRDFVSRKHLPNLQVSQMEGTPLYTSRHVDQGQTPSRRDDLFSIALVFAELLIRLQAGIAGNNHSFEKQTKFHSYLPWANETSEDALAKCKEQQVLDHRSPFYQQMPGGTANVMFEFFTRAHSIEYAKVPDYDAFRALVSNMSVALPGTAAATKSRSRPARNNKNLKSPPRSTSKSVAQNPSASLKSPPPASSSALTSTLNSQPKVSYPTTNNYKTPASSTGRVTRQMKRSQEASSLLEDDGSPAKLAKKDHNCDVEDMSIDESFCTALTSHHDDDEELEPMEVGDESIAAGVQKDKKSRGKATVRGLELQVTEGPQQGETFILVKGVNEVLVFGTKSRSRTGEEALAVSGTRFAKTYAKLSLTVTKGGSRLVKVDDLGGMNTYVNKNLVPTKKTEQAFPNDLIRIGSTVINVLSLSGPMPILEKENVGR